MAFPTSRFRAAPALIGAGITASMMLAGCSSAAPEAESENTSNAAVAPPSIMNEGELTVCTTDAPPNVVYDENNELQGVEIDIASAMAEQLGLALKLEEYDFSGLIPALQAQQCDVIMGSLYIKPEREEVVNFVPYLYSGTGVGVDKSNPKNITGLNESLCGLKVSAITGATGAAKAKDLSAECEADGMAPLNITLLDSSVSAVQQILNGQQDAYIDTTAIMGYSSQRTDGEFVMVGEPSDKIRIGAASLKSNTELHDALDAAFQALVEDGSYLEILKKWDVESNDITQPK